MYLFRHYGPKGLINMLPQGTAIIGIVIAIVLGAIAAHLALMQAIDSHATSLYRQRDVSGLASYLERGYVKRLMPAYNHGCLVLAQYELAGDTADAQETIYHLLEIAAPGEQRHDLAKRAINYFVSARDSAGAHRFVNLLRTKGEADLCDALDKLVEIELDGSDKYLDEMRAQLEYADAPTKRRLYALIAKQYDNHGDNAKAKAARESAQKC